MVLLIWSFGSLAASEPVDDLDRIVIQLEQDRLMRDSGFERSSIRFPTHFFQSVIPVLRNERLTARDLEERLRKWNTGMHLLAIKKDLLEQVFHQQTICVLPVGDPAVAPEYWLFMYDGRPDRAAVLMQEFHIPSSAINRARLHTAGVVSFCQES